MVSCSPRRPVRNRAARPGSACPPRAWSLVSTGTCAAIAVWYSPCGSIPAARRSGDGAKPQGEGPMRGIRRVVVLLSIVALGVALARDAAAGQVSDQLRSRIDRVIAILEDPILKVRPQERRAGPRGGAGHGLSLPQHNRGPPGRPSRG